MENRLLPKGEQAEEFLRQYFLSLGYYVLRSCECKYQGFDVTDVDLWLYSRPSPISRERANVDIKMKKSPQALERIFWTKGLQLVLGLEKCIVATTDRKPHVADFGIENDVMVFDGNFMSKLSSSERFSYQRLTENDLYDLITKSLSSDANSEWKKRYTTSKSKLLTDLNFDGANHQLRNIGYFLQQYATQVEPAISIRLLYLSISFFLINIDYLTKDISYKEPKERHNFLSYGIRFGEQGRAKALNLISTSSKLVSSFLGSERIDARTIEQEVMRQYQGIPSDSLAEHFSNTRVMKNLFNQAKNFESLGMSVGLKLPQELDGELQADIGLLCDFFGIDRRKIL